MSGERDRCWSASDDQDHPRQGGPPQKTKKKKGPRKEKEFLDVAHEAFIRYLALDLWRRVEATRHTREPSATEETLRSITAFDERFPYQDVWFAEWRSQVADDLWTVESADLLGRIERMVAAALDAEERERTSRGDVSLHDEDDFIGFVDDQLAYLFSHRVDEFLTG